MKARTLMLIVFFILNSTCLFSFAPPHNPKVDEIVNSISEERIADILKKLESFETRNLYSEPIRENFGIQAARDWISEQFKSYSPRLKVYFDCYHLKQQGRRLFKDIELCNVVAVLPGKDEEAKERIYIVNAHYDSVARSADGSFHYDDVNTPAPGVNDDGSGVAAILEMARVMSQYQFEATIYFVAFAGEEQGLVGSSLFAQKMKKEGKNIAGVITLDLIGNIEGGNGYIDNKRVRVFSSETPSSPSQELAIYIKRIGERYFPDRIFDLIFRIDRFGRGADHIPFLLEEFPAARIMDANENYSRQHTTEDTFENMSLPYCAANTKIAAACLASLAWAPPAPRVVNERNYPTLSRGESGYDAHLQWQMPFEVDDLAGYKIFIKKTTSPFWEKEVTLGLGKVNELLIKNFSIDNNVFGIAAVDQEGNESQVASYMLPARRKAVYETIEKE